MLPPDDDSHYNIVQNNGTFPTFYFLEPHPLGEDGCREIPNLHFHIIPQRQIINDGIYYFPHIPPRMRRGLFQATTLHFPADEYRAGRANIDGDETEDLAANMWGKVAEQFARVKQVEGTDLEKVCWLNLRTSTGGSLKRNR